MAAASWVTGADPIVLLRALSLPMAFALCGLGAAAIAVRITGAPWVGVVALGLQLLGPLDFSGWRYDGEGPLDVRLLNSPSAGFANAALLVGILLSVEIIRGRMRGWLPYAAAVLAFIAMFGAKCTALPTVMAGLLGVVVFTLVSQRRLDRSAGVLFILSVLVFVLVKPFFFGSGSRGLAVDVFGLFGEHSIAVGAVGATVRLLTYWVLGLPLVLMLLRRSGRTPESVLVLCLAASGFAAALAMHQSGFSEWYFAWGVLVPMTLGSAIGIEHVVRGLREDVPETWGRILGLFGWVALGSVIVAQTYVAVMPDDATFTLPATFGAAIRTELGRLLGKAEAAGVRLLYGGSVKPANAAELMNVAHVDGALVGGASLKAEDFLAIARACAG